MAVLLLNDLLAVYVYREWRINEADLGFAGAEAVLTLVFGWLALRSCRWWPLAFTGSLLLILLVHLLAILTPVSLYASISARIGLWLLLTLILLAGVFERWLAGEPAVSGCRDWRRRRASGNGRLCAAGAPQDAA